MLEYPQSAGSGSGSRDIAADEAAVAIEDVSYKPDLREVE